MILYRICKSRYAADLMGKGAELVGGRWNSKGVAVIYTSSTIALCMLEVAVHVPPGMMPEGFERVTIEIPDDKVFELTEADLPPGWSVFPHLPVTQLIGDEFVYEGKFLVMKVPSAVVPGEFNYIINPNHPDAGSMRITDTRPYNFDKRLFDR